MRLQIETVGDLIRTLQTYPQYMKIFNQSGKQFEDISYNNKIPFLDLSKDKWKEDEGLILK